MDSDGKAAEKNEKISGELFAETLRNATKKYESTPEVYCPYLKDKVHLNRKGFEHIKLKAWNKARGREDQYYRLRLLHLMPEVLLKSHTVQGIWHTHDWERVKSRGSWIKVLKNVSYYEFVAVLGRIRLKIVVKEIEGGAKFFWTIIPFWKMNLVANKRVLHEGDPETD
jgi:hypothetical protein